MQHAKNATIYDIYIVCQILIELWCEQASHMYVITVFCSPLLWADAMTDERLGIAIMVSM